MSLRSIKSHAECGENCGVGETALRNYSGKSNLCPKFWHSSRAPSLGHCSGRSTWRSASATTTSYSILTHGGPITASIRCRVMYWRTIVSDTEIQTPLSARGPRQNVFLGAWIAGFGGGQPTQHRVRDLSSRGARVDRAGSLKAGATVLVSVGTLEEIGATVAWVKDDVAGLRFAQPIDPAAARSKTILARPGQSAEKPGGPDGLSHDSTPMGAGWASEMRDPYRK